MEDFIVCGIYVKDGIENPIVCYPEEGDIVVQFDDIGPILLENVIVTSPRDTEGMDLHGLLDFYKADGVFGTTTEWVAIRGEEVAFYPFKNPGSMSRKVETSYNISYEE